MLSALKILDVAALWYCRVELGAGAESEFAFFYRSRSVIF